MQRLWGTAVVFLQIPCHFATNTIQSIDAFTLNVGDPYADFTTNALEVLFTAAKANSFSLFLSMDLYARGDLCYKTKTACNGVRSPNDMFHDLADEYQQPLDFVNIIKKYGQNSAWYKYNGLPSE